MIDLTSLCQKYTRQQPFKLQSNSFIQMHLVLVGQNQPIPLNLFILNQQMLKIQLAWQNDFTYIHRNHQKSQCTVTSTYATHGLNCIPYLIKIIKTSVVLLKICYFNIFSSYNPSLQNAHTSLPRTKDFTSYNIDGHQFRDAPEWIM